MASQPTPYATDRRAEPDARSDFPPAIVHRRAAAWAQLLPAHRRTVLAKTPLLVALGLYLAGGHFAAPAVWRTMALAAALWAALYALNESTDLVHEHGLTIGAAMQATLFVLPAALCLLAACLAPMLALLFALMTLGQIAYCVPPFRLKRYWWAILLLSGTINPVLRLQCGALWGSHGIPPLAYAVVVALHLGAGLRSRALLRERDRALAYHVAPRGIECVGMVCTFAGFAGAFLLCAQGVLPALLAPLLALATVFSVYAWSGRETSVARLRQGWLWFTLLAALAMVVLLMRG
jgi:hypothetical protein